ncbi:hypothetical protein [uncultured Victivallis sp.]|uniref:hypothetical protein n=1 Tax=uncultured Victivallis sp. TaxID=354118 RepID=UPI00258814D3|nr:hypothetical protein [uncultured Victivallis sp.]
MPIAIFQVLFQTNTGSEYATYFLSSYSTPCPLFGFSGVFHPCTENTRQFGAAASLTAPESLSLNNGEFFRSPDLQNPGTRIIL